MRNAELCCFENLYGGLRFFPFKGNGLPQPFCVSPAGSVGASAPQRCPPDTRTFAMTKRYVILSAEHERIRIPLEKERIAAAVCTASQ